MKDDLNGLDKAVSAVLGERTIERNQLLIRIAKSKLTKQEKNEKATKPEELVRLYDLLLQVKNHFIVFLFFFASLSSQFRWKSFSKYSSYSWQNVADLSDLVSSGRDRKPEEVSFSEECALKSLAFRAERLCILSFLLLHCACPKADKQETMIWFV